MTLHEHAPKRGAKRSFQRKTPSAAMVTLIQGLIAAGKTYEEIAALTGATKYLIWRTSQETGLPPVPATPPVRATPTSCNGEPSCTCVWHRAEAVRLEQLAARRKELQRNGVV